MSLIITEPHFIFEEIGDDYYMNSKIKCGSVMIKDMTIGGS